MHGYNVPYSTAVTTFSESYKRAFWQGFRGNFVGFAWYGNEGVVGQRGSAITFNENVNNALHTSGSLWLFIRNVLENDAADGGWGVQAKNVTLAAHSLGNLVAWDALRLNDEIAPSEPLVNNMISIEAAVWAEAFYPESSYLNETADELEENSWVGYFDPSDVNIRAAIIGNVVNSFYASDSALAWMSRDAITLANGDGSYRTASNLAGLSPQSTIPLGIGDNPIANVNIDASTMGWDTRYDPRGHSDFYIDPYPEIFSWWTTVFAKSGIPIGTQVN